MLLEGRRSELESMFPVCNFVNVSLCRLLLLGVGIREAEATLSTEFMAVGQHNLSLVVI